MSRRRTLTDDQCAKIHARRQIARANADKRIAAELGITTQTLWRAMKRHYRERYA